MKTVFITGANKGIGFETTQQLAQLNYFVYLGCRNKEHGLEAIQKLHDLGINNVENIQIDVADINSVRQAREDCFYCYKAQSKFPACGQYFRRSTNVNKHKKPRRHAKL